MVAFVLRLFATAMLMTSVGISARDAPATASPATAVVLRVDGAISPASADYVERGIAHAVQDGAVAVVLEIDTPGGLDKSMRVIVKAILASPVPVIGYVAPGGSRAASAGTYILYAAHIAAMAPATNLGAATPVELGGSPPPPPQATPPARSEPAKSESPDEKGSVMPESAPPIEDAHMRKATNDAVAYIRALAERRGRNADWGEKAVREAVSASAEEALKLHVIDLIAPDVQQLLAAVDGRQVATVAGETTLRTRDAVIQTLTPDWRSRFLAVISDPSVAYLLLLLGLGGLLFEGYSPGVVLPGVVGAICLLLALYALQMLPVNYAGLGLIALGIALLIAETAVPAYGSLGIGGIVAFVIGSVILMDTSVPGFGISLALLVGISLAGALALAGIIWMALRARARPVVSGREQMIGATGEALEDFNERGSVYLHGERWQARALAPVRAGHSVRVTALDGLVLTVKPMPGSQRSGIAKGES